MLEGKEYLDLLHEIASRPNESHNKKYEPKELENIKTYSEMEDLYKSVGLDFLKPMRSEFYYTVSDLEFVERVENLTEEGKTDAQKWLIGQVKKDAEMIKNLLKGVNFVPELKGRLLY